MKRILFAINNKTAEQKLSKLIKEYDPDETYQVVGTLVSNESITDFLSNKHTDILVYIEGLSGKEDGFDYILRLHRQYPSIRIVFIAGQRSIGDKKLATLVAFHIYDIIAGQRILMTEVAERIVRPANFEDVMMYLPDSADLFHDNDFAPRSNHIYSAQDDSERIAEKASYLKQIADAEQDNRTLNIKLSAVEAQLREMEAERADWREELSRERMVMEKSFEAEKKTLNATIIELNEKLEHLALDKETLDKMHLELKQKYETQSKTLSLQQNQSSVNIKALQNEIRSLKVDIEDKEKQLVDLNAEFEALKHTLKESKEVLLAEAQSQADALIASANKQIEEAAKLTQELKDKIALYGDDGFAAYKAKETAKLDEAKELLKKQMDAEYADHRAKMEREYTDAQHAKLAKINELNSVIEEKEALLSDTNNRIKEAEAEIRKAKNAEIARMDAAVEAKRREIYQEQEKFDAEVKAHRETIQRESEQADETIKEKLNKAEQQIVDRQRAAAAKRTAEYEEHVAKMAKEQEKCAAELKAQRDTMNKEKAEADAAIQASIAQAEQEITDKKRAADEKRNAEYKAHCDKIAQEQEQCDADIKARRDAIKKEAAEANAAIQASLAQAEQEIAEKQRLADDQRNAEYQSHRAKISKELSEHTTSFDNRKQHEQEQIDNMHKMAQEKIDAEYAQHKFRIEKELNDAQTAKVEKLNELNKQISEKEDELRSANSRVKAIEVEVRQAKQAEIERIDAAIAAQKQEAQDMQAKMNAEYAEHRARIEKESADAQAAQNERIQELDTIIAEKELLITTSQSKIKSMAEEVRKARQKEMDKVDEELANTEQAIRDNQEKIREEYEQHRVRIEKELVEAQKVQLDRIAELDGVIAEKYQIIRSVDRQIEMAENEVREAKQAEIERMNAIVEEKRTEFESEKNNLARNIAELRSQKMSELAGLDADIAARQTSIRHLDMDIQDKKHSVNLLNTKIADVQAEYIEERKRLENDYEDRREKAEEKLKLDIDAMTALEMAKHKDALNAHKEKIDGEMEEVNKAFSNEKRRLSKEFEVYRKEMIEKRAEVEMEYGTTYTYNEQDFITGPSITNKCQSIMVYSPVPGTGNSTLALNLATLLAMNHKKVVYVELNTQHPTLKEHLGISIMKDSLDTAFQALRIKSFNGIEQNIITKQRILNLKTSAFDMQTRYPDMLSYMTYTEGQEITQPIDINFLQGLVAFMKYKKHYDYVIFDVPSYFDKKFINDIFNLCNKHIVSTNQDILSLNNIVNMKDYIQNLTALERTCYMVNRYIDNNTVLSNRKIAEICKIKVPGTIPSLSNDAILSTYKSIPMILITQSKELINSYKSLLEYIVK